MFTMRKTGQNQRKKELFEEEHLNTQSRLEANVYGSDKKSQANINSH